MRIKPHTVQHRLQQWGRWMKSPRIHFTPTVSPAANMVEMKENAGIHGDGMKFEIIDGVSIPPDGGMSRAVERRGRELAHDARCRETNEAVMTLPLRMREAVIRTFVIEDREDPRTQELVAELMHLSVRTVQEYLETAYERVSRRIYGTFEVLPDPDERVEPELPGDFNERLIEELEKAA